MTSRRDVLRLGAQVTAAGLAATVLDAPAAHASDGPEPRAWRELARALSAGAGLYRPGDGEHTRLAPPDNLRYAGTRPAAIVACAAERDVQVAVRWAVKHGVPLAPRSGGHNYAGYSTTRGLLIHLRRMRGVSPVGRRSLVLGGGATNSDVYEARAANLYFPGGRCPGVGVAGLTLGGGLGFNDRKWGLSCDRLRSTRVVLADGSIALASDRHNADLFWACRGGAGGNFGINTGFVFDAVQVTDQRATVFDLSFGLDSAVAVTTVLQEILDQDRSGDFDVRIGFSRTAAGAGSITILGQRLGTEDQLRPRLAGLLALRPGKRFIEQRHFWTAQDYLMAQHHPTAMASKSLVPTVWLEPHMIETIASWVGAWQPGTSGATGYVTLFAMGVHSNTPTPTATAFPHRDATFVIDIGTEWNAATPQPQVQQLLAQTRLLHRSLSRELQTSAAYVNFPDPDLPDWPAAYYGANYNRLTRVKSHYDPRHVFRYDQAVCSDLGNHP
ncbi:MULTISPECIES: FAD-dependent oxidoreductase [unclassified Streptomyces]|uniref:FAD-binding oxidoreductase n=1 Tax=unclassified Streptomyces TaxID=2593676 RepID=UPI002366F4DE|nr:MULTISPECIES: FAD-dependent oxidoreductase [unclassified Streptomyces]MDF3140945.1 FAD-dependent oxidoreductase [Streptomyces sp. T21Q-yed]WDF43604.1 FAD-dependent oxidoreductase [Streptomyces sp. T12]